MFVLLPTLYFFLFAFIIYKCRFFRIEQTPSLWNVFLFSVKVLAACLLYVVYTRIYSNREMSDIFKFFDDSEALFRLVKVAPGDFFLNFFGLANDFNYGGKYEDWMNNWLHPYGNRMYNDNRMMIRIHAFLRFFSGGNYHVHSVFFAFGSFIGLQLIAKAFAQFVQANFRWMYACLFLFPSVLFWGSGCLKETIVILEIGVFTYAFFKMNEQFQWKYCCAVVISVLAILFTKFYLLIVLLPCAVAYWVVHQKRNWKPITIYTSVVLFCIVSAVLVSFIHPSFDLSRLLISKQHGFVNVGLETLSGSLISDYKIANSWWGIISFLPTAWYRVVFLPWPIGGSWMEIFAGLENVALLLFVILRLRNIKRFRLTNEFCFALLFIVLLYTIIGITVPVMGAMVRYKVPAFLFLFPLLWMSVPIKLQNMHSSNI